MTEEESNLIIGALDSLGVALADHDHEWTEGERCIYEAAVECVRRADETQVAVSSMRWLDALKELTNTVFDEANRLANHCSDGAARWACDNLYTAANKAKAALASNGGDMPRNPPQSQSSPLHATRGSWQSLNS